MLNWIPEPAVTLTREVRAINQNVRVFITSLADQSRCVVAGWEEVPRVLGGPTLLSGFSRVEESIGTAPSGYKPMSSGRRRTTIIKGMVRIRLAIPKYRNEVRQPRATATLEMIWMFIALVNGRNNPVNASARLRLRSKKFTATVRGTNPMSRGWLMARPITAKMKNCQMVLTPPKAYRHTPNMTVPAGISHRGP